MIRSIAATALALGVLAAGAVGVVLLVPRLDLGPVLAHFASAALGRPVTVGALHIVPGRWLAVELKHLRVVNIEGGSRPAMIEMQQVRAEVEATSLLRRPIVIRSLTASGLSVLLQRTADRTPNWRFGQPAPGHSAAAGPAWLPTLLDARIVDSDVTYRTAHGAEFRTRLDRLIVLAAGADAPVRLTVVGAYGAVPVSMNAGLQSFDALRAAAAPFGADLHLTSGTTALDFAGSFLEPLEVDGADGRLTLIVPSAGPLPALVGNGAAAALPLRLAGRFRRRGDVWQLSGATGMVKDNPVSAASFGLTEGGPGKPDAVSADIAFDRLDLDGLASNGSQHGAGADIPLAVAAAPDPLVKLRLSARRLSYDQWQSTDVWLSASQAPGQVAVQNLALTYLGARLRGSGRIDADAGEAGRVSADLAVDGADVEPLRRALGFGPVPLAGKLAAKISASSTGATLNAAARTARVSAAVSMTGGRIARQVIEMGSTDLRLLLRKPAGSVAVSCLLGVLDLRAGIGTVLPLRIRTAAGAMAGTARFDLNRRSFDLIIGSQRDTTGTFALDIPVRVFGSFASPTIRPARWSAAGRAMLAASNTASTPPSGLQSFARQNACFSAR